MASKSKIASDFCFLNDSSIVATVGINPNPSLSIWDMLLPPNNVIYSIENNFWKINLIKKKKNNDKI